MKNEQDNIIVNDEILRALDRGIDDMEAGNELPLDEAFARIEQLREERRRARA